MLEGLEGRTVVVQTSPAQQRAQGVRVFYGQARALSLMRKRRVGGIAEEHHPAAAPPGQTRQVDESPETHVPLDVADEIEDARIPAVFGEDSESLVAGGRQAIRGPGPGRQAVRLVHGKQVHQFAPVQPVADSMRTGSAPDMECSRIGQVL